MPPCGKIQLLVTGGLVAFILGGGGNHLPAPVPGAFLSGQDLPVTGHAVHYLHAVSPGQSLRISAEGDPYLRVKVRLAEGVAPGAWSIDILDAGGRVKESIPSGSLGNGIWTSQVWSREITLRVPQNGGRVLIVKKLRVDTPLPVQNVIPRGSDPNFRPADTYPDPGVRDIARAIVHLRMVQGDEERPCTGLFLSGTLIMTNEHCVPTDEVARQVAVLVGYNSSGGPPREVLRAVELVASDFGLDYSVIRLATRPSDQIRPVKWRISGPVLQERVVVVQHPNGQAMQVADDNDCYVSEGRTRGRGGDLVDFGHRCDTMDGSSGSLVLGLQDLRMVGIHHWGVRPGDEREQNQGVRIDEIFRQLKQKAAHDPRAKEIYEAVTKVP